MLDFGVFPPEINSGRMYAGPGPGSMLAAAAAWDGLAAELRSAATSYGSVVSGLTSGSWLGPASASMAQAAAPYVTWMASTAGRAEETATQAKAAVAAYEAAFAATVPPPVIAANRAQLAALIATNFFGQNSPAIAATEAEYGEMWAQDAAAMYGYASASAAATKMAPFIPPTPTTSVAGLTEQAAAVNNANATPAGSAAQTAASTMTHLASTSAMPQLSAASSTSPAAATSSAATAPTWSSLLDFLGPNGLAILGPSGLISSVLGNPSFANQGLANAWTNWPYFPLGTVNSTVAWAAGMAPGAPAPSPALGGALPPPGAIGAFGGTVGHWGGPVSASVGQAGTIGRLSVPASWAAAAPQQAIGPEAPGLLGAQTIAHSHPGASSGLLRGVPLTGAGIGRRAGGFINRYGFRHAVMPRPPSAG
ncbi:PPE family protein [uncultured Mycobacterium sp.]|uniref:PPE family protein n=1 Tax=uncultured Mycobacterium sp. TaxID=171292 RepID=UPI0035C9615A